MRLEENKGRLWGKALLLGLILNLTPMASAAVGPWQGAELRSKKAFGQKGKAVRVTWRAKPAPGNCVISLLSLFNGDRIFTTHQGHWSEIGFEIYGGSYNHLEHRAFQTQYITYESIDDPATHRGRGHDIQHGLGGPVSDIWDGGFHDFQIEWLPAADDRARIIYRVDGIEIRRELGGDVRRLESQLEVNTGVWISTVNEKYSWGCSDSSERPEQTAMIVDSFQVEEEDKGQWVALENRPFLADSEIDASFDRSDWGFESFDGTYCPGNTNRQVPGELRLELDRACGMNKFPVPIRPSAPTPQGLQAGLVYQIQSEQSGLCLEVIDASKALGMQLQQAPCNAKNHQKFLLQPSGAGSFELKNQASGLCVDVRGKSKAEAAEVLQYTCHGGINQKLWIAKAQSGGSYQLRFAHSSQCLDLLGRDALASGARAVQNACTGTARQNWILK